MKHYGKRGDVATVDLDRSKVLDHEVLAAARFCAAASGEPEDTRFLLDTLGIRARATELAAYSVGRTGWLGPLIRRLKPTGYLELRRK